MILGIVLERMQSLADGGVITSESRYKLPLLESMAVTFLGKMLQAKYVGSRTLAKDTRINPLYYRKHYPIFNPALQDASFNFVVFDCPPILSFDTQSDGIRYCGTLNGTCGFQRIHTRQKLSDINNHRVLKTIQEENTTFLYDGNTNLIEVYGNDDIQELLLEIIPQNPLDIPTFNKLTDDFIADGDLQLFLTMNFTEETSIEKSQPIDLVASGSQKTQQHK